MPPPSLTRPLRRLRADSALETLPTRESSVRSPTVLIARALCRFERVRTPAGLGRRAALAAARLHARTRAPFAGAASAVARTDEGFGVWWWDAAAVGRGLAAAGVTGPVRLRPEAAAQAAGEGWRLLRTDGGYEAQRWRGGGLTDSAWRRRPFDPAAWRNLVRGDGPAEPPAPQPPVFTPAAPYGRRFVRGEGEGGGAPAWTAAAALASLCLTAFLLGQGVGAQRRDARLREEIARLEADPRRGRRPELAARARRLEALGRLVDAPGPLETLALARARLRPFGLEVTGFDAAAGELVVSVPDTAAAGVDLLVEELQATPPFADVRPSLDRAARRLTLRMRVRPPAAQAARR